MMHVTTYLNGLSIATSPLRTSSITSLDLPSILFALYWKLLSCESMAYAVLSR